MISHFFIKSCQVTVFVRNCPTNIAVVRPNTEWVFGQFRNFEILGFRLAPLAGTSFTAQHATWRPGSIAAPCMLLLSSVMVLALSDTVWI